MLRILGCHHVGMTEGCRIQDRMNEGQGDVLPGLVAEENAWCWADFNLLLLSCLIHMFIIKVIVYPIYLSLVALKP